MKLGQFELTTVSGGSFRLDGGTMFGVVPKAIWRRAIEVDEDNTISQTTNCLLVRGADMTILIDTGYGSRLPAKQREFLKAEAGTPLLDSLAEHGVRPADVNMVILTHLHFDHAGGCLSVAEDGELVRTFPNAEYVVQLGEWNLATADLPELENAYPSDNFLPLRESGALRFLDGEEEIANGIRGLPTPGHTQFHQSIQIESEGQVAVYLGDLCPSTRHLASHWCMAYDTNMLETRRQKTKLLGTIADRNWLALFDHDPDHAAARLRRDEIKQFLPTELIEVC